MIIEKTENMITYRIEKYESVDKLSFEMLSKGGVPGFIVIGRDGAEIKIPVAGCQPLLVYLQDNGNLKKVAEILRQAILILDSMDKYFLDTAAPILKIDYAYVTKGEAADGVAAEVDKLRLICLPVAYASAVPDSVQDFLRGIVASSIYEIDEREKVYELLSIINSIQYDTDMVMMKLDELVPPERIETGNSTGDATGTENEKNGENEEKIKKSKKGILRRVRSFFIVDDESNSYKHNGEIQYDENNYYKYNKDNNGNNELLIFNEELPQGINVIAVRGTDIEYPLCFGPDIIGTDESKCGICFPNDITLGKEHCTIKFERGRYVIEDLGCQSGTKVNGNLIAPHKPRPLSSADLISVGAQELVFSHRMGT